MGKLYTVIIITVPYWVFMNNDHWIIGTCIRSGAKINVDGLSTTVFRFVGRSVYAPAIFLEICEERMKSIRAVFMGTPFRLFNIANVHDLPLYHYKHICIYFCKIH